MTEAENTVSMEDIDIEEGTDPRVYELGFHIIPAISDEDAPREAVAVKELIKQHGGTPISEQELQHITLAYTMYRTNNGKKEKFDTAHFAGIKFEINPVEVDALKADLDLNKNILRYIIFKTVRENTRTDVRVPQGRGDRKVEIVQKSPLRKEETSSPVSETELDKSIEEIVVE